MGAEPANFERRDRADGRTLVVTGEIDLATARRFGDELTSLIHEAHSPALVDLTAMTFIDSSGLSALVAAHRAAEGTEVRLVLINPSPGPRRVLEISGIDALFEIRSWARA